MKAAWIAAPYLCILAYVVFIFVSSDRCMQGMEDFYDMPYHVTREVREIRMRLQNLRNILPVFFSSPNVHFEQIEPVLNEHNKLQDKSLEIIRERLPSDPDGLMDKLLHYKNDLREARIRVAKATEGNSDFDSALALYTSEIVPPLENINEMLSQISQLADQQGSAILRDFEQRHIMIKIAAVLLCFLVCAALLYIAFRDKEKLKAIRHREKLFNLLSENVDDVFFISKNNNRIEFASSNSGRVLDVSDKDILQDPDAIFRRLGAAGDWLKKRLSSDAGGEIDTDLDGGEKKLLIKVYPVVEKGVDERNIVMIRDQTELIARESALKEALCASRQASAAKSNFLAHMSHEIRTPMNAIIGMSTIALAKIGDQARVADCLGKIGQSSRHLLGLINDVLDMSKIERGKLATNIELFNFPATIENIVHIIRPQALEKDLNFELAQSGLDVESLYGDSLRLNQILLNLLSNALKFTPKGGTILFKVKQASKGDSKVILRFTIKDTGIGMSQEFQSRLYSPFEQAAPGVASRFGGTGLGLAITKNLVELLDGVITLKSEEGKGTEFIVELPFELPKSSSLEAAPLEKRKILVIDDDPSVCEEADMLLSGMGMEVETALSGEAGLEMLQKAREAGKPFEVCFLDWTIPEMDGGAVAAQIMARFGAKPRIIILSSHDWGDIQEQAEEAGALGYVAKPFFASSLKGALASLEGDLQTEQEENRQYDFSGKKILLVEDNEFNREISLEFLDMVNAEAENAVNGHEAVEKFSAAPPFWYDAVLMDIQMPVMNGYQAARAIRRLSREDAKETPIIAMTANAFNEDVAAAREAGMNDHIPKPINVNELYAKLERHMALFKAIKERLSGKGEGH